MKKEYDLSTMKRERNPYLSKLKKPITIRLRADVIDYFKKLSEEYSTPYQTMIDSYLADCMKKKKKPKMTWVR